MVIALASLAFGAKSEVSRAATADSITTAVHQAASVPQHGPLGRRDVCFAVVTAGLVGGAALNDPFLTGEATESHSSGERRLAGVAQPFGNPAYLLPALLGAYGVARVLDHPAGASSIMRVGVSTVVAGAAAGVLKEVVGRSRPSEEPNDADLIRPFSGRSSFPSGHAAVAFAAATAIDCETTSRWVPLVVYPVAALLGWSRVHDRKHWTSDVVAGAAIGSWTALKTETLLLNRASKHSALELEISPGASSVGLAYRF